MRKEVKTPAAPNPNIYYLFNIKQLANINPFAMNQLKQRINHRIRILNLRCQLLSGRSNLFAAGSVGQCNGIHGFDDGILFGQRVRRFDAKNTHGFDLFRHFCDSQRNRESATALDPAVRIHQLAGIGLGRQQG